MKLESRTPAAATTSILPLPVLRERAGERVHFNQRKMSSVARSLILAAMLAVIAGPRLVAAQARDNQQLADPLLDELVGDWQVTRTFRSGRTVQNNVHAEWVLNHQWLKLEYPPSRRQPRRRQR